MSNPPSSLSNIYKGLIIIKTPMRDTKAKYQSLLENNSFIKIQAIIPVNTGLVYINVIASDSGRNFIP
jgi:hypothetical protein